MGVGYCGPTGQQTYSAKPIVAKPVPPKASPNSSCVVKRIASVAKGLVSLGIGFAKLDLAAGRAVSIPATGPFGALGAAYLGIGASGNIAAAGMQLTGALTGNVSGTAKAADLAT